MCVIYLAFGQHPDHPLILLANRDEFYKRPSAAARYWDDAPEIYAGRDLEGGGTWLGVTRSGRFAAVTNYRDPSAPIGTRSRGELVADFLKAKTNPDDYMSEVRRRSTEYSGFNLIVGELNSGRREIVYYSNRGQDSQTLSPGIYGLSNHLLDTPWPKVVYGKDRFRTLLAQTKFDREKSFEILADKTLAADEELPSTGVPYEIERSVSAIFIERSGYGTRCSTVLTFDNNLKWELDERVWV